MAAQNLDIEELEVTVEVLPQTVNDIVYMSEDVTSRGSVEENSPVEEQEVGLYEFGTANPVSLTQLPLVLDESQTFVILPQGIENENVGIANAEYTITSEGYLKKLGEVDATCVFSCHICSYKCLSLTDLDSHVNMCKRAKDKYVCNVCGEIFERAQVLSHHFKTNHQKPVLVCNICGCPCVNEAALTCHYKKHEPKAFCCDVCEAEYDNAVSLNNHVKTHTTKLLYACNKCDAGFSSTSEISVHLRTVHAKAARRRVQEVGESGERVARMRKLKLKLRKEKN